MESRRFVDFYYLTPDNAFAASTAKRRRKARRTKELVYITEVQMSPEGTGHKHIAGVRWRNPGTGARGENTRAQMVDWIENKKGEARVRDDAGNEIPVGVVDASPPYIRTYADGVWTDNLLDLPRYQ
jgi:Protein of unknown function (DUF3892)